MTSASQTRVRTGPESDRLAFASTIRPMKGRDLAHRVAEDARLDGRIVTLDGRGLVNCGSCSYLGLSKSRCTFALQGPAHAA
jgi:hypothetical protein